MVRAARGQPPENSCQKIGESFVSFETYPNCKTLPAVPTFPSFLGFIGFETRQNCYTTFAVRKFAGFQVSNLVKPENLVQKI